jgi:hypothetical protein
MMRHRLTVVAIAQSAIGAAAYVVIRPEPAHACSWSYARGNTPAEIRARSDVRRVVGTFIFREGRGTVNDDGLLEAGRIFGRIETRRGTGWDVFHPFSQFAADCTMPQGPTADARGTFWISRQSENGQYQLRSWEGEYLPARNEGNGSL